MPLAWIGRKEALQHMCDTPQKKNWIVTQGGIWISLESLQPLQCKMALNRKELRAVAAILALSCCSSLQQGTLAELPCPSAQATSMWRTQQDWAAHRALLLQLTALSISIPHNNEEWTAKGTYTLTCHRCFPQRTPVHLLKRQKNDNIVILPYKHRKKLTCISCKRVISNQQGWGMECSCLYISIWTQTGPV